MANTVTHNVVATGTNDAGKQVSKDAWNEGHDIYIDTLTGTAGGAAAAGAAITLTGGTGDSGADAGASITVGGGDGAGNPGVITVVGVITGETGNNVEFRAADDGTEGGAFFRALPGNPGVKGGNGQMVAGSSNAAGVEGGSIVLTAGDGDAGADVGASIVVGGGTGAGAAGTIEVTTGAASYALLAGTADPSAGAGIAANICSQFARDNGGVGELWVKTGATDTGWTKVI